ncbi:hypothetical protein CRUP_013890 [Coryphaenoides rupestris]|nr:hypothetical protein CRUP_013890 [Coryphaenoides rupestris]
MLSILAAGSVFFPGLFLLSKQCLKHIPGLRWSEGDAVIVSARLVSSVQALMASSAGYIIASSCDDIIEDHHWLTSSYILFAVPYFVYDIYAMFMCYWYKLRVKGHEEAAAAPQHVGTALRSYLWREFLMVLHHVVMVAVCFPVSVGRGDYFQGVMFMAELSTPSVCLGKILIQHSATKAGPCSSKTSRKYASIPFHLVPLRVSWQCNLGAALLMAPQLYWFSLICRGALRLFTRSARRPPTSSPSPANGYSTRSVEAEPSAH